MHQDHHSPALARSRRAFLQQASALLGAAAFGAGAQAQTASGYKALVCIFLAGGNDGHNTVVPLSTAAYNAYRSLRGGLALPDANTQLTQVLTPAGVPYGLNSGLNAIAPLWGQGKLAVVANVGMLSRPITRAQYLDGSVRAPSNLFSHSDQIQAMQTGNANGSGGTGWGGRTVDAVQSMNGTSRFPSAISMAGNALFCAGSVVQSASLIPGFDLTPDGMTSWPDSATAARKAALNQILALDSGLTLIQAANKVRQDAVSLNGLLAGTGGGTLATAFPGTDLGRQLQQVAKIIQLRASTGITRQVFFCSIGGFDLHSAQSWAQWDLLRQVGEAMSAFYNATVELGVASGVTTFTESDFGRTLQPSGSGTDHGWGSHHLVMGGAVRGGDVYGSFPFPALGGPDDCGSRGALIPSTSLDQYGATLAKWFGVGPAALAQVFPNLGYFPTPDLGFMG
ncbi:MAG: DUF1501 domain-containing protein [Burkholderiales bacterium]|nr:DUF1501 domain-containing protein [Burkholderiales bacterium]